MNHAQRKTILLKCIQTLAADIASHAESQSVQPVLHGIERLHQLGFSLHTEMKSNAILQDIKAREVQP
ncbi:MAG: hypothetical protein JG718_11395 [Candidatus Thiothrix moscowensis]|nr:hypothetical protein [Candidatus Thiothrix moscowensis]